MKIGTPFAVAAVAASALLPAGAGAAIVVPEPINPTVVTPETVSPQPAPKSAATPSTAPAPSAAVSVLSSPAPAPQAGAGGSAAGPPPSNPPAGDLGEKTPDPAAGEIRLARLQFEIAVERALWRAGFTPSGGSPIFGDQNPGPPAPPIDAGVPTAGSSDADGAGALLDAIDALFGTSLHRSLDEGTPQQEQ